jgi:hypothetical protein
MTTTADLLNEYGEAIRGAWGDIDGRSVRGDLAELAEGIREFGNTELPEPKVLELREGLGVCPKGQGHWEYFCSDFDEEEEA